MFTWKDKRAAMKPVPPIPMSTKEKEPKLVSICNRGRLRFWGHTFSQVELTRIVNGSIDQNSRTTYFEGRIDVGSHNNNRR